MVADKVAPEVDADGTPGARRQSDNLAARNWYLQGRYHLNQRTEEGLHRAVDFFEKAIIEDTQFSLAHSGLADAYGLLAHYGVLGPADVWAKATSSAASAVMLDGHSAEAHTSLAHVRATQDWDFSAAEQLFQKAIQLNPRYSTARHWYAMSCLVPMRRLDEALEQILLAHRSIRCRRSSPATSPSRSITGATSTRRWNSAITRSSSIPTSRPRISRLD